jgi:hypothetical protein
VALGYAPVTIDIIIECKLLVLLDAAIGKDPHANMLADSPFRNIAIWITTMVRESAYAASFRSVDKLVIVNDLYETK